MGLATKPLVRRVLWGAGTALAFVILAMLGLGLGSLLSFGETPRAEPEPVPPSRPTPSPVAEPAPPPPRPSTPPPPATPPPPPAAEAAPPPRPFSNGPWLGVPSRLRVRREVLRDVAALRDELARCPADPVARSSPTARAALVLDAVAENGAVRVESSRLDADGPVNDRFVSCARSVFEGKRLVVSGTAPGRRLRLVIPLGPNGNALSLPAASVTESGPADGG